MTTKQLLELLSVRELQALANFYGLQVRDRRVARDLIHALAKPNVLKLKGVLSTLPRERLKDICRALNLADNGKEKKYIIKRILETHSELKSNAKPSRTRESEVKSSHTTVWNEEPVIRSTELSNSTINNALLRLRKRAESIERSTLVNTFVDTGALSTLLASHDHQVIYGRRGTGKTHALLYLADIISKRNDACVYIDMRTLGSTGGLHADPGLAVSERATRLLIDTLTTIHAELTKLALDGVLSLETLSEGLDVLATASSDVQVREATLDSGGLTKRHRVHFGTLGSAFKQIASALAPRRLWILIDEWSVLPLELQPYLADLIRRVFLPITNTTIKIAAIEHRSRFRLSGTSPGDYIGIELGADASADLNLDDFMVFDNDANRATSFFGALIFKHFKAIETDAGIVNGPTTAEQFLKMTFTQKNAFDELVVAAEGVPRDAIHIIALSAQRAIAGPISIPHVRTAATTWYQRDKETAASANSEARAMLVWIVDEVISHRRTRAFLLRAGVSNILIDTLFDARVLHILKRGVAAHDQPGIRYDVFKIDYGCYVDLIATKKAPLGLLPYDRSPKSKGYIDVPPDDYRAIRRAILNLDRFANR